MQAERWVRVKEIFAAALEREADERLAFIEHACANDADLLDEVRSLLEAHDHADDFIERPAAARIGAVVEPAPQEWIGRRLGYYEITAEIGRGGMSQVLKAVRADQQYEQEVAIKVLRAGFDNESLLRRFRAERQILARLSHPHIAHLIDGGTTDNGSPYLVMEYIEGQPIDEYCAQRSLSLIKRLDLFRTLCLAVHYVHQHLMVHGDIKAHNVLVTQHGVVKLLDFGIAKLLTAAPRTHAQGATTFVALTPEYASPEQVRGEALTTASDVYSLGVLLYVLLAGELPHRVAGATPWELTQEICHSEPELPSVVAARSGRLHASFAREIAGDLDNIVRKALKKDPDERYGSAEQLAQDIRSYLRGFPVQARPDTTRYRVRKFTQRHKGASIAGGLFIASLLGGIVATSWQAHVAREERARAERHFREVRELTNTYMSDVYDAVEKLPGATAVRRLLVENSLKYLSNLEREAHDSEELQRDLAHTYEKLGDVQGDYLGANLGDTNGAIQSYRHAIALREALVKRNPTQTHREELLRTHINISELLTAQSRIDEAVMHSRRAIELGQRLVASSDVSDLDRRYLAASYLTLGWQSGLLGRVDEGMQQMSAARDLYEEVLASNPKDMRYRRDVALAHSRMGDILLEAGRAEESIPFHKQAAAILEPMIEEFPTQSTILRMSALVLITLAEAENASGHPHEALEHGKTSLARLEHLQEVDSANEQGALFVAYALNRLADSYAQIDDYEAALAHLYRALDIVREAPPAKPTDIAEIRLLRGSTYHRLAKTHSGRAAKERNAEPGEGASEARRWSKVAIEILTPLTNDTLIGRRARQLKEEAERIRDAS